MFQVKRSAPMTNAERQARWRAKHRPAKRKGVVLKNPEGMQFMAGTCFTFQTKRSAPLTNAERQARWRAKHRPAKRRMQWGPDGELFVR